MRTFSETVCVQYCQFFFRVECCQLFSEVNISKRLKLLTLDIEVMPRTSVSGQVLFENSGGH